MFTYKLSQLFDHSWSDPWGALQWPFMGIVILAQLEGVQVPLSRTVKDFRFILLEKCGHYPWFEKQAKDKFYEVLERESGC